MTQLFSRSADPLLKLVLWTVVIGTAVVAGAGFIAVRSPDVTGQYLVVEQAVPFSHQHHVADVGIDCRHCHQSVETSAIAGVPPTRVCMSCHHELWDQSEMLEPVRASWKTGRPLVWNRIHDLPDYAYFDHSIHIHKGIGCYECHGYVGRMPLTYQAAPLTMEWCLDCHRSPEQHVRPRSLVFNPRPLEELTDTEEFIQALREKTDLPATSEDAVVLLRRELADDYDLHSRTDCYTCHR